MCGGDRQPDKGLGPEIVLSLRRMDNEHIIQRAWDQRGMQLLRGVPQGSTKALRSDVRK
jgi:hypothetical protein